MDTEERAHRSVSEGGEVDKRICPCGSPENEISKLWIFCDCCKTWFHSACVLMSDAEVEEILTKKQKWFCDFVQCQDHLAELMATKRKSNVGASSSPVSSPMATKRKQLVGVGTPVVHSPAVNAPVVRSPVVRLPVVGAVAPALVSGENVEREEDELNMSDDEEGGTRIGDIYIPPPVKPYCSTESIGPRLIITKISNCNFKSYAGKVVLGPFSNCFHAIIGPNGSGKSNVIDSMLFVFGYRANKIRCKKLSVLIHKSSAHENINSCSVAVHFSEIVDKPDGSYEMVENSNFFISRTAFRDNSSFYTINDKKVHFKEVAKVLKKHNVDLDHNRFLILQGEVESIAMMKPKGATENECGLLEYLEDIVGTTRYKDPLQKINSRVEILTEESTDKHNRCKMAQREMDDLNAPKDQAIEYINMENERTRTQNLFFQKMMFDKNAQLTDFQEQQSVVVTELKDHDDKYAEINRIRLEKEKLIKDEMEQYEKLLRSKEEHEQKLTVAMRKAESIDQTMVSVNKQRKQYKAQIKKEEEKLVELKKIPSKNASEIAESETKIEKLSAEKAKIEEQLEKNLESLQDITQPLIEKKEKFQNDLLGFQTKVDECKSALSVSSSELKICQHSELSERQKYNTWKQSLEESKTEFEEKKTELKELQSNLPEAKQAAANYRQQLQDRIKEENELSVQLRKLRSEVDEKNRAMKAVQSNNRVLDGLMKQKINGAQGFEGVYGRLGDLGGIPAKYDVAISTCCSRLENIVVDTVNTATTCINYMKSKNLGRATFIALDKMRPVNQRGQYPENVHRMYDLVEVEDQSVRPAFYFALQETLVADDIDQATRIAYGNTRYRTVTLKGELIETSGSMSGGGRPRSGRMGRQVKTKTSRNDGNTSMSADNVAELQVKVQELSTRISYCQEQQGQLERDLRNVDVSVKQKETAVKRLASEVNSLEKSLPQVEQQCEEQRKRMEQTKSDPAKVKELQATIQKNEEALQVSEAEAKKIKDKVTEVEKKIKTITAEKVKSLETKIDDLGKQIAKLSKNVSRLKVEVNTSERNCVKTEEAIANLNKEVINAQELIVAKDKERVEAYKETDEIKAKVREIEAEINKAQCGGTEIKKEIHKLQEEEQQGKVLRVDIEQKLQAIEKLVNDVKEQLPKLKYRLKVLKLREIPKQDAQEPLKVYQDEELTTHKTKDLEYKISCLDEQIQGTTTPNIGAIEEYYTRREVYLERVRVLEDITKKRNEMRHLYDEVRKRRHNEFKEGFNIITRKLREMYQMITQGGDAELELVDSMDPFTEGVSFSVRPPKKTWKNISNLSGGEKTLSSLALVFALHYYKPSPLYFMDEIDAALDFKNVSIVANYIRERTRNAQFIIISLRTNMFELSHCLTGIYKVHDCTQSLSMSNSVPEYCLPPPSSQTGSQAVDESFRPSQEFAENEANGRRSSYVQQVSSEQAETTNNLLPSGRDVFDDLRNDGSEPQPMDVY